MQDHEITITFETTYTIRRKGHEPAVFPIVKTENHLNLVLFVGNTLDCGDVREQIFAYCRSQHESSLMETPVVLDAATFEKLIGPTRGETSDRIVLDEAERPD